MKKELSERKKLILCSAIDDYIKDASPITSGSVKDRHINDVSTATLRNELNALEAMGYLKQLHTSGGRVPTTDGYRYYVSTLLENFQVSKKQLKKVESDLNNRTNSLKEILESDDHIEVMCNFCSKKYDFSKEEVEKIIEGK